MRGLGLFFLALTLAAGALGSSGCVRVYVDRRPPPPPPPYQARPSVNPCGIVNCARPNTRAIV